MHLGTAQPSAADFLGSSAVRYSALVSSAGPSSYNASGSSVCASSCSPWRFVRYPAGAVAVLGLRVARQVLRLRSSQHPLQSLEPPATHPRTPSSPSRRSACCYQRRGVALTFDDGPSEFTPALLDELAALNATAAFFVIVEHALSHPETVRRALREGHTVGLHTRSHPNLTALWEAEDWARLVIEIDDAADDLQSITGERPVYFRPPYGAVNRGLVEYLHDRGFAVALWTSGCIDWAFHSTDRELPAYIDGMQDSGGVLCLHDSCNSTVVGTPDIVAALRSGREAAWVNPQGRELISLDRCTGRETHASGDAAASGHRGVDGAGAGGGMGEDAAAAPSLLGAAAGQRGNGVGARMRAERGAATARRALLQARRW